MRANILLLVCLIAAVNCAAFTASGTVQVGSGTPWPATVKVDTSSSVATVQIAYSFGITELELYNQESRYQICPSACKNYFLSNPIPDFGYRSGGVIDSSDSSLTKYTAPSNNGYVTTIWVKTSTGAIVKVKQEGNGYLRVFAFTTYSTSTPTFVSAPSSCQAVQCGQALDLMLVVDSSGSISDPDYVTEMDYAQQVIDSFTIGTYGVHAGLITFATDALLRYPLTDNKAALTNAITNAQQQGGETNIGGAINLASQQFAANARGGAVPKVIILLTDGKANRPVDNPITYMITAANTAKANGVLIYAIGVGPLVQQTDLNDIASSPTSQFTSLVSDFNALQSTIRNILQQVCVGGETDGCNPTCYSDTQFCGCGSCMCVGDSSLCGSRGTWNAGACSCSCTGSWGQTSSGHTCTRCGVTSCQNGGTIVNNPSTGVCGCNCPTNFDGSVCENCNLDCIGTAVVDNCAQGTCTCPGTHKTAASGCTVCDPNYCDHGTSNAACTGCNCEPNWDGTTCSICNWRCAHGGTKNVDCQSCSCNTPWGGDNCDNCQRTCLNGGTLDSVACTCSCTPKFSGSTCNSCSGSYCKNGGSMNNNYPTCTCNCPAPWTGVDCTTCGLTCASGTLNSASCTCTCAPGYTGPRCDQCDANYCVNGAQGPLPTGCDDCICAGDWGGLRCDDCLLDQAAHNPHCITGTPKSDCSGCNCPKFNGTPYIKGTYCDVCDSAICIHGSVGAFPTCSCACDPGFTGRRCNQCISTLCSHGGTPADQNVCDSCVCDPAQNWSGRYCEQCAIDCGLHGTLDTDSCHCVCDDYWKGNLCTDCHNDNPELCDECSYNGVLNEECTACLCDEYHTGEICSECRYDCNGNGHRSEDCETCICDDGWLAATNCTVCDTSLNSVFCNGRGTITNAASGCNTCTCENLWSAPDCRTCSVDCHGHGRANNDCTGCVCDNQWDETTNCLVCDLDCNGNGTPNADCSACICDGGYITTPSGQCNTCDAANYVPRCVHDDGTLTADCECDCIDQWSGPFCNDCDLSECANGDVVDYQINGEMQCRCRCYNFWTGDRCDYCPFLDGPNPQYTCPDISIPVMTDCSCHCPEYYRDIEGCDECIITNEDCVHVKPGTVPDLTKGVCKCICDGNWSGRNCSICDPNLVICATGFELDTSDCICKEICGDGLIVGNEECEDSKQENPKDEVCCTDCYYDENLICDDFRSCTRYDFCQVHPSASSPTGTKITCDGTDKMDYTVNADRETIPLGQLVTNHWTKWGITVSSTVGVSIVDPRTLGYPSTNPCGGDIVFDRVLVATNGESNGQLCFEMTGPVEVQSISVINNAKEPGNSNSFHIEFYCTNTINPITVDARNYGPGSVEYIRNPCTNRLVTRICYRNFPSGAIGPVFFCDDNNVNLGRLGDYVWYDISVDNIQDANELPVPNVPAKLIDGATGRFLAITYTNDQGLYIFEYLYNGNYSVEFNAPSQYTYSTPVRFPYPNMPHYGTLDNNFITDTVKEILTVDVGIYLFGAIGDYVWYDYSEDGTQEEASSYAIAGVTMNLYETDNLVTPIRTQTTNTFGNYLFAPLPVYKTATTFHTYVVEFVPPTGSIVTVRFAGSRREIDSNFDRSLYRSDLVPLTVQKPIDLTIDAGVYYCCGSVGDRVWYDMQDTDGVQDTAEDNDGVENVRVTLYHNNVAIGSQYTDANGYYLFTGLPLSGVYYVHFDPVTGYVLTSKSKGLDREKDSDANPNGDTDTFQLTRERPDRRDIDAGVYAGCTVASECTTNDKCKSAECVDNKCVFTPSVTCAPLSDPCVEPVCQPSTGVCVPVPKAVTETIQCDDRNACTHNDICVNGVCQGTSANGPAFTCTDNSVCTTDDICVEGTCVGTPCPENPDPCIKTVCDSTGCHDVPDAGAPCNDGNLCTTNDVCGADGRCGGTPKVCQNNEYCKLYECDPGTGRCKSSITPNVPCSDGDDCTTGDTCAPNGVCRGTPKTCTGTDQCTNYFCEAGQCKTSPKSSTTTCNDNDSCTENDRCRPDATCAGTPKNCNDGKTCTTDVCDSATGSCTHRIPSDAACTDNDPCTDDICDVNGNCLSTPINCDDGKPCTVDKCVAGVCEHNPSSAICTDNNLCTVFDTCDAQGNCRGVPKNCDDSNECTDDYCDVLTGLCRHDDNNEPCDDNNECTANSYCTDGECRGYDNVDCRVTNPCSQVSCDRTTGSCIEESKPDGSVCTTNDLCRLNGVCESGECRGRETVCNDNDPCTKDSCSYGTCIFTPSDETNGIPCDDGNKCTIQDVCAYDSGFNLSTCRGVPMDCDDGDICTNDLCYATDGLCHHEPAASTTPCDDNNACTLADVCVEGTCQGTPKDCSTTDTCKESECSATTGECVERITENEPCNDGRVCTINDVCTAQGICRGRNPCADLVHPNPCKSYICSDTGDCIIVDRPDQTVCNDGNACTRSDVCVAGQCRGTDPFPCTSDACNRRECVDDNGTPSCRNTFTQATCGASIGCRDFICSEGTCTPVINRDCNAGNTNTCVNKVCLADGTCGEENVVGSCEDGDPCTVNACRDGACVVTSRIEICGDTECTATTPCPASTTNCYHYNCVNNRCVLVEDTCTASTNPCIRNVCNPATDQCEPHKLENTRCDDSNRCTSNDICVSTGSGALDIECRGSEVTCPDRICERGTCNPANGLCRYSVTDDVPCDDGLACTESDRCDPQANCRGTPKPCDDGNTCTNDSCDAATGACLHENNDRVCNDGNLCTSGDKCVAGVCVGSTETLCGESTEFCKRTVCDPINGCVLLPVTDGTVCGDNTDGCLDGDAVCVQGVCVPPPRVTCPAPVDPQCPLICVDNECRVDTTTPCDDNDACTTQDRCRDDGHCHGSPVPCSHLDTGCARGVCFEGSCVPRPISGATECDDGDECTLNHCDANGLCASSPRVCLASSNPCETFTCDRVRGCVAQNNPVSCTPTGVVNLCVDHICIDRVCTEVPPTRPCNDNNPCTSDQCFPATGECVHEPNDSFICNDNDPCTDDVCRAGVCTSTPKSCNDDNVCTTDKCEGGVCVNTANELSCHYSSGCITGGVCSNKRCVPSSFSDCSTTPHDQCQSVACDGTTGACILSQITDSVTSCNDGDDCTTGDVCTPNGCRGTTVVCAPSAVECKESYCSAGQCVLRSNNNLQCHSKDTACGTSKCLDGACVPDELGHRDCSDTDLCTFNETCGADGCTFDSYSCLLSPCIYSTCNDDGLCVFDRNVTNWDPLTYLSFKTFINSTGETRHYLVAISSQTGNLRGFVRLTDQIITLAVVPFEGGLYAGVIVNNDFTTTNIYRIPVNATANNVFADGVRAGWPLINIITEQERVDFTFKPNFVAENLPHTYDLWGRSRGNDKLFSIDVTTQPTATVDLFFNGYTSFWKGATWDNHGRWIYGADQDGILLRLVPDRVDPYDIYLTSGIDQLCDGEIVVPEGRFIDMFTRYDESIVGATDNDATKNLTIFTIRFGLDLVTQKPKCFTSQVFIDKTSFTDGSAPESIIQVQAFAFDDTICATAIGGPVSNGGNVTSTGGTTGHGGNTGGGSSPPPVNPPGSVISHQGGSVPANHVPGTTDNNVLTGGTGAIATGVVSAIGTTAVAAFAIFAVVLGLNNTKKDPPANLTAALVSTDVSAIASDNPLFQGMNDAGTNILA